MLKVKQATDNKHRGGGESIYNSNETNANETKLVK